MNMKIWKLVLTGGPCGGKTTSQARLCTFFENLGWKVYRVPETANILLSGGVKFADCSAEMAQEFQCNLLKTMMQIENTFFALAEKSQKNCLVICDRGAMDASAYISKEGWDQILRDTGLDEVEIRDNRYDQVIHMVSAAVGAENFYTLENHACRNETVNEAKLVDKRNGEAWVGHPNIDTVDNNGRNFQDKVNLLISKVAWSLGIDPGDRLMNQARKVKFIVYEPLQNDDKFPVKFRDFEESQRFLQSPQDTESRLRKRGRKDKWTYILTKRKIENDQMIEVKKTLTHREYLDMLNIADPNHHVLYKTRRCFLYESQYFELDIYKDRCHEGCKGVILLETYTTLSPEEIRKKLPPFLKLGAEITDDPVFTIRNMTLRNGGKTSGYHCNRMSDIKENRDPLLTKSDYQDLEDAIKQGSPCAKLSTGGSKALMSVETNISVFYGTK